MIEVMIAILLTAICVIGMIALFRVETRASSFSRRETEAAVLAQDKLEELRTEAAPVAASSVIETGLDARGMAGGMFDRQSDITLSAAGDTYDIVVTVSWDDSGTARSVVVRGQRGGG